LKFEVWDGTNEEVIESTEKVFHAIVKKLDTGDSSWQSSTTPMAQFVIAASTECSERLHDPTPQHILGSGRILRAIGSASHQAFDLVVRNVMPRMLLMWDDESVDHKRTFLLDVFNNILRARLDLQGTNTLQSPEVHQRFEDSEAVITASLGKFQHSLVDDVFIKAMAESDAKNAEVDAGFQINAIQGLVLAARIPSFLSGFHKEIIVSEFCDRALDRKQTQRLHDEVVLALAELHMNHPELFQHIAVSKFLAALPNPGLNSPSISPADFAGAVFVLETFSQTSCARTCRLDTTSTLQGRPTQDKSRVFDSFQSALMEKMFTVLESNNQLRYACAILAAMLRGLEVFDEVRSKEALSMAEAVLSQDTSPYAWIILSLYKKLIIGKKDVGGITEFLGRSASFMGFNFNLDNDKDVNDLFVSLLGKITTLALRSNQTIPSNNILVKANKAGQMPGQCAIYVLGGWSPSRGESVYSLF
jgi:DNA repair/transcription protein MET18/MMS19